MRPKVFRAFFPLAFLILLPSILYLQKNHLIRFYSCRDPKVSPLILQRGKIVISDTLERHESACFHVKFQGDGELIISSVAPVDLITSKGKIRDIGTKPEIIHVDNGSILIWLPFREKGSLAIEHRVELCCFAKDSPVSPVVLSGTSEEDFLEAQEPLDSDTKSQVYNFQLDPPFQSNAKLQSVVNNLANLIEKEGLSTTNLSMSIVDLNSQPCCNYASFDDREPRFPASIVKLFWITALYGKAKESDFSLDSLNSDAISMISDSDNDSASRIVDAITDTTSGRKLTKQEYELWMKKRNSLNMFFLNSGYTDVNIIHKNFPIKSLSMDTPEGRDSQLKEEKGKLSRNYLTTRSVARLLYEIETENAIDSDSSKRIKQALEQELDESIWAAQEYNSIEGFFGQSLRSDANLLTKVGWTSSSRQEASIISTDDGSKRFILVVFGESSNFSKDWKIFPKISSFVFEQISSYDN